MYKLIIEDDEGKTTVVPLIRDEITIGRKEGNTIRLTERNVSRKHARLLKQNGSIFIEDVSSYNGIKLNGDKIDGRAPVGEGDRIQIGDYQLALKMDRAQGAPGTNGHGDTRNATPAAPIAAIQSNEEKTTPYQKESGVPTQMIEAPTMQTPMAPVRADGSGLARLVVTSSNFAGQEFLLDKAAVVIGRTDENDVVINHRSISRHHAKVVRENGHYHVVDLQSANGVRVNGEEYGKVELRRGDHIDLGHVRLRFVAPGEDFIFERDAQVVDVTGGKSSRTGLIVALVVVALAGGGFAAWKITNSGPSVPPKPQVADVDGQVSRLLLDADRAMKSEEWELAIQKCDEALRLDPAQEIARDKKQHADAERKNRAAHQRFQASAEKNDLDGAVAAFGEISEDSIYHQRGAEAYARVKKDFVRAHLDQARTLKAQSQCDAARQHVEAVLTVEESNQEAVDLMKGCGVVVKPPEPKTPKVPKPPVVRPEKPVTKPVEAKPEVAATPETDANPAAEKALADAGDAYVHGQYATAIELARKALKAQPAKASRIMGASSCFLKDRAGAVAAFGKLDAQGRQFLKWVCARSNITVP
jgi:pSer/pThr/pTyr-binding forkhead associated (FHA) protein/tetratricopeptide (TPR) repeat protein